MYPDYNMYNQYYGFREYNYRNSEMKEELGEIITLNQPVYINIVINYDS